MYGIISTIMNPDQSTAYLMFTVQAFLQDSSEAMAPAVIQSGLRA